MGVHRPRRARARACARGGPVLPDPGWRAQADERASAEAPPSGEDAVDASDRAARVRAALAELPESQRVVVVLHRYEGLTFGEIARALGTTEGAVKLRAFRAYERLRVRLAPLAGGEEGAA